MDDHWYQFGMLLAAFLTISGSGLKAIFTKLNSNKLAYIEQMKTLKNEMESFNEAQRTALGLEAKEIRSEFAIAISKAYLELGEGPKAIREHVTQIEIWARDYLLPRREYERDQDKISKQLDSMMERIDGRFIHLEEKIDVGREN